MAGSAWTIRGRAYRFAEMIQEASKPQAPWHSGSEGIAFPLKNRAGEIEYYAKFFKNRDNFPKRMARVQWLIDRRVHKWGEELLAAPCDWIDTGNVGRPDGIDFDFRCSLSRAVSGSTWQEVRNGIQKFGKALHPNVRLRCAGDLIRAAALLEREEFAHGDLAPANLVVDFSANSSEPMLRLVDFDAFNAPSAGDLAVFTNSDGGVVGHGGYMPVDLYAQYKRGGGVIWPYSDRFARDMLLIELFCYAPDVDSELAPCSWPWDKIEPRFPDNTPKALDYLRSQDIFVLEEEQRPSSYALALKMEISVPPRIKRPGRPRGGHFNRPSSVGGYSQSHGKGAPVSAPAAPGPSAPLPLERTIVLLWSLCLMLVLNASFLLARQAMATAMAWWAAGTASTTVRVALKMVVGVGTMVGGVLGGCYGLAAVAEAGARSSVRLPILWMPLFARRGNNRGQTTAELRGVVFRLAVIVATLVLVTWRSM